MRSLRQLINYGLHGVAVQRPRTDLRPGKVVVECELAGVDVVMDSLHEVEAELDRLLTKYAGIELPPVQVTINNYNVGCDWDQGEGDE